MEINMRVFAFLFVVFLNTSLIASEAWTSLDLNTAITGVTTAVGGDGFDIRASGTDIWGTSDGCTNKNKCPLAATTMAALHEEVVKRKLQDKVRLLVVTYDPEFDTPQRLKRYGEQKGIKFDDCIQMIRPPLESKDKIFNDMDITVNYSEGMVNIHGIQLVLLDKNARIVRNYHTVIWDNNKVADDLAKLVLE
jgi:hypothetical protein